MATSYINDSKLAKLNKIPVYSAGDTYMIKKSENNQSTRIVFPATLTSSNKELWVTFPIDGIIDANSVTITGYLAVRGNGDYLDNGSAGLIIQNYTVRSIKMQNFLISCCIYKSNGWTSAINNSAFVCMAGDAGDITFTFS